MTGAALTLANSATMTRRNELAPGARVAISIEAAHVVPLED